MDMYYLYSGAIIITLCLCLLTAFLLTAHFNKDKSFKAVLTLNQEADKRLNFHDWLLQKQIERDFNHLLEHDLNHLNTTANDVTTNNALESFEKNEVVCC